MQTETKLSERAMLVYRENHGWSGRRFDKEESRRLTASHGAEADTARVNKLIVPRELLQPIEQHDGEWQRWHEAMTLPYPAKGYAILLTDNFFAYTDGTSARQAKRQQLVEELALRLPAALASAPQRLGGLLKAGDLPDADSIVKRYRSEVVFLPFPEASQMGQHIDAEVKRRTDEYLQSSVVETAMRDVWQRAYDAVAHMVDRLNAKDVDPSARLYASVVDNIVELVDLLPRLNLTGDTRLEAMRQQLSARLIGSTIDELKEDDELRHDTSDAAKRILESMQDYIGGESSK